MKKLMRLLRTLRHRHARGVPLITVRIHEKRIRDNLRAFATRMSGVAASPVLKSNAYGHGLLEIARIVDTEEIPFITVDSYFEAHRLRIEGVRHPILILGYSRDEVIAKNTLPDVAFTIGSVSQLKALADSGARAFIHLKIDTGMHRQGIVPYDLPDALKLIAHTPALTLEGVCSHLADADSEDIHFTHEQIKCWNGTVDFVRKRAPRVVYFHLAATAGSFLSAGINANVIRVGLGLYGITTNQKDALPLVPALELWSVISATKELGAGDAVGYNCTYTAESTMRIALIPAGYFEGIDRRLSNKGSIRINDTDAHILGRVSMNITTVDVTHIASAARDVPVQIISATPEDTNSVVNIAEATGQIPYEVLVGIPESLHREVV